MFAEEFEGVLRVVGPLVVHLVPFRAACRDFGKPYQGVVQHRDAVDGPSVAAGVDADLTEDVDDDAIALQRGRVVSVEQRDIIEDVRDVGQGRDGLGVDDGVDLAGAQRAAQVELVVGYAAAVVVGLDRVFAQVDRGGRARIVQLEPLAEARAVEVFGKEEVRTQPGGVARLDGDVQAVVGKRTAGVRKQRRYGQTDGKRGGINGTEVAESVDFVFTLPQRLEIVSSSARAVEDVARCVSDDEEVGRLRAFRRVAEMDKRIGEAQASDGLIAARGRGNGTPIAARRQAEDALHLHRLSAEGHAT